MNMIDQDENKEDEEKEIFLVLVVNHKIK